MQDSSTRDLLEEDPQAQETQQLIEETGLALSEEYSLQSIDTTETSFGTVVEYRTESGEGDANYLMNDGRIQGVYGEAIDGEFHAEAISQVAGTAVGNSYEETDPSDLLGPKNDAESYKELV